MPLGENSWFSWKSKAQMEREQKEYDAWAFPHGSLQRENVMALLQELYPTEKVSFLMMGFLTCKELYGRYVENLGSEEKAVYRLVVVDRKYKNLIRKNEMPRYVAFVQADALIGEDCAYPAADEMRTRIEAIEALTKK